MKKNKLKLITIILLIVLITAVGFFGIYVKDKNSVNNVVKDYEYGMDLDGRRVVTLELDTSNNEIIKDSDGKTIEGATEEEIQEKGYTKEEQPVNSEESKNIDNYKLAKEIIENRLKKMNVSSFNIRIDENSGRLVVELPENDNTDNWLSSLTTVGKLEIVDSQTKEVLLNNDSISNCKAERRTTTYGTTDYFVIEFNNEGKKKLEDISRTYVKDAESSQEQSGEETASNEEKTVTMQLDGQDVMTTSFEEPITNGQIMLTVGQASTDQDTINENKKQAEQMSAVLSNKKLPLKYNINGNIYIQSSLKDVITDRMISILGLVILIAAIILIIKYKTKGLLATIAYVGFVAVLLIMIRYWNVVITTEGIAALVAVLVLNFNLLNMMLSNINKEKDNKKIQTKQIINKSIKDYTLRVIPLFIMAIVFVFIRISFYK